MYEEASQIASDAVGSIRTVASFCAEKRIIETYNSKCEASMNQGVRTGWIGGLGFGFSFLMLYLTYALCFYVGAKFVEKDKATFNEVFKVIIAMIYYSCHHELNITSNTFTVDPAGSFILPVRFMHASS